MDFVSDNSENEANEINVRARRINPKKCEWKNNINQKNRMKGEEYMGMSKNNASLKLPRKLGLKCTSNFCVKSSLRHCSEFSEDTRKEIFNSFWQMSWHQKQQYVVSLVSVVEKKQCYTESSNRTQSEIYFLKKNSRQLQVCRQMFLSTLALNEKMVRNWVNSAGKHATALSPESCSDIRIQSKRSSANGKRNKERRAFLQNWLDKLPTMESHYCRKRTKKLYFEANFTSCNEIYKIYVDECSSNKENVLKSLSYPVFAEIIKESNLSIFKPKNDECDICVSYKAKNISEADYEKHREEIEKMREEKRNDILNAEHGLCGILCMDAQAVKLLPQLNANSAYYKMKLQIHNFTIYNLITHDSDNYVWDESDGKLVASVFTTCIIKHLKLFHDRHPDIQHIIIYSDGCFYQNRNVALANALLTFWEETNVTIEQKYLVSGHTQMECDATHSLIERKLAKKQIYLPSQLVDLIREARKSPAPLQAYQLHYDYFQDWENTEKKYTSIRPGRSNGNPTVNMIRALAYDSTGYIYYKIDICEEYEVLPQRTKTAMQCIKPCQLYSKKLDLSKKKWDHLQDLKKLLPKDCHSFFDNLPYKA